MRALALTMVLVYAFPAYAWHDHNNYNPSPAPAYNQRSYTDGWRDRETGQPAPSPDIATPYQTYHYPTTCMADGCTTYPTWFSGPYRNY